MSTSSDSAVKITDDSVHILHRNILSSSSSEEPPMEEWSSLENVVSEHRPKMALFKAGLYSPGSGNICTKYVPLSDSEVLKHPYYNYLAVKDPGILEALLESEPQKTYLLDGQDLYLDLCKEMNMIPVRKFHRNMLEESIDLRYYGVNPLGIRAMCLALTYNRYVRRLDLTGNVLNEDACYHLGRLLAESVALRELVLTACGIQADCMRRLSASLSNRTMDLLDLSKNKMGDHAFQYLANQIKRRMIIKRLNLSHNDLGTESALAFADAIEFNNNITHLDLSWNNLSSPKGINGLLRQLSSSTFLVELKLAWNALTIGTALRSLLAVPTLEIIDLSNNRLSTPAAKAIALKLHATKQLDILDLSYNPFSPSDAFMILNKMRAREVRLKHLLMDNISVDKEFVQELKEILTLDHKRNLKVTHGKVLRDYILSVPDIREILLKRMDFLTSRATNKCRLDMALYFLQKFKERELMQPREILRDMKMANAPVDEDLVTGLALRFPGPMTDKGGMTVKLAAVTRLDGAPSVTCLENCESPVKSVANVYLAGVVEMIHRMWPDKQLPPTPPEPQPEILVNVGKKKKVKAKK